MVDTSMKIPAIGILLVFIGAIVILIGYGMAWS